MLTGTHSAWKSTSAPLLFCTSGGETVENLEISRGQLAPCQEKRITRQQTVSSARYKVLAPNVGFLLASMPSYCRFKPIECSYSESVSVSVPKDKFRGSAILQSPQFWPIPTRTTVQNRCTTAFHPATSQPIRSCADCRLFLSGSARIGKTAISVHLIGARDRHMSKLQ